MNMRMMSALVILCGTVAALGQTTQPAPAKGAVEELSATALEVAGTVQWAKIGTDDWQPVKQGDVLRPPVEIRTGLRSSAVFKLHTTALIQVGVNSRMSITELSRQADVDKVRLGLRRGMIRGGIIEETGRSDFKIACPAAVLSREGTWGFQITYDPATNGFRVDLDTDGLVRVLNTRTGKQMGIRPGEYVTQAFRLWVNTAVFERMVSLVDKYGMTSIEEWLYANYPGGGAALNPTGPTFGISPTYGAMQQAQMMAAQARLQQTFASRFPAYLQNILREQFRPSGPQYYQPGSFGTHIDESGPAADIVQQFLNRHVSSKPRP